VNRRCINFDKLSKWRLENSIDMGKYFEVMKKPKGVKQRPMADQYYAYYRQESPNHINGTNKGKNFNI
jgi:hypothetical protein